MHDKYLESVVMTLVIVLLFLVVVGLVSDHVYDLPDAPVEQCCSCPKHK